MLFLFVAARVLAQVLSWLSGCGRCWSRLLGLVLVRRRRMACIQRRERRLVLVPLAAMRLAPARSYGLLRIAVLVLGLGSGCIRLRGQRRIRRLARLMRLGSLHGLLLALVLGLVVRWFLSRMRRIGRRMGLVGRIRGIRRLARLRARAWAQARVRGAVQQFRLLRVLRLVCRLVWRAGRRADSLRRRGRGRAQGHLGRMRLGFGRFFGMGRIRLLVGSRRMGFM